MMAGVTSRQPSPRSDFSAADGLRLIIRHAQYLLILQLTFISEGNSPIRHLGTRLVGCRSAPTGRSYKLYKSILLPQSEPNSLVNELLVCGITYRTLLILVGLHLLALFAPSKV